MEPAIRQYEIQPRQFSLTWRKKIVVFFAVACFMFGFRWVIESFLHWEHQSLIRSLLSSAVAGALFAFRPARRWLPQGSACVIIGNDFIEGRTRASWFTFKKRISREKITSISENRRGLTIMDRGQFAARMLGFIFIPATLPEYQEVRSTLAQWAPVQGQR
jgi:hypothetical protein